MRTDMTRTLAAAAVAVLLVSLYAAGAEFPERWVYISTNLATDAAVSDTISIMRQAKAAGCTHVLLSDYKFGILSEMQPSYFKNVGRVRDAAAEMDLAIVPEIFSIGYSSAILHLDPNLAAGIPVRDAPFMVKGKKAVPDPASVPSIANAGFDDAKGDKLAGWEQDFAGEETFVDREVKHSGAASLKMTNLARIPKMFAGHCRVMQTLKTQPFQYYRLSVWTKTRGLKSDQTQVLLLSDGGKRQHCYMSLGVKETEDWTKHEIVFNSLEASSVLMYVGLWGAKEGTIWWDDVRIEPAGLLNVIRGDYTPVKVASSDGGTIYSEGKDFERAVDPQLGKNDYSIRHDAPTMALTGNSRIKDGERLLVSFYHPAVIKDDQVTCSLVDPKVFTLMEDQMKRIVELLGAPGYFMSYDEIRVGGWEEQPGGAHLTPGQLLAKHVSRAVEIAHKYAPKATLYTWSDMFDPYHNARPFSKGGYYYLVNGTWEGSWEVLPKDVVVCTWIPQAESLKWFADRGHRQILGGYYDSAPGENVATWMKASRGVPGIVGMVYTTWEHQYKDLPEFFRALKEYKADR